MGTYLDNNSRIIKAEEFKRKLSRFIGHFQDIKESVDLVLLISHMDADGYACSAILKLMLEREGINYSARYYNRKNSWKTYLDRVLRQYDHVKNLMVIFSDLGSEINELGNYFSDKQISVFILDHHEIYAVDDDKLPDDFHYINPTIYGFDGLKEIAGSTLVYLFTKEISIKNSKSAWIALIGISNDTLMKIQDYRSFNRDVLEDAIDQDQIILREGLMLFGATHESIKNALAYSLFPFIKEVGGNPKLAGDVLDKLQIPKSLKVAQLSDEHVDLIDNRFPESLKGQFIEFPKKKGILRYAFEHGILIGQTAYKKPHQTDQLVNLTSASIQLKEIYQDFIQNFTKNLALFVRSPKEVTNHVIFVDANRKLSRNFWSDVASYASVNHLYDQKKILCLSGVEGNIVKISVRCTEQYPPLAKGKGVDFFIQKIKKVYGGMGGGHKLAGGYKITPNKYIKMKKEINSYFPL